MSEWVVIAGLTLAIVWSYVGSVLALESMFLVKHVPVGVFAIGIVLSFIASSLRTGSRPEKAPAAMTPARLLWPLLLLAIGVITGSTYGQAVEGVTNTFRNFGVSMLAAYLVARLVTLAREPVRLVTVYFVILVAAGFVATVVMTFVFALLGRNVAPFHELEFMIIPLVVYVATKNDELNLRRIILVWGGLATAVIFQKNTGYLIAMGTVLYLWWFHWRVTTRRANAIRRAFLLLIGITFIAGLVAAYSLLRAHNVAYIPSGNTEFRMYTYERAWQKFLGSPLWGDVFAGAASEEFDLYDTGVAGNVLPTHSDVLDLLAHGGLVALMLFLAAHWRVIAAANRFILCLPPSAGSPPLLAGVEPDTAELASGRRGSVNGQERHVVAMTHTFICMALLAIVTIAFNPLLGNPVRSLLIWGQLGFIAGLACHFSATSAHAQRRTRQRQ